MEITGGSLDCSIYKYENVSRNTMSTWFPVKLLPELVSITHPWCVSSKYIDILFHPLILFFLNRPKGYYYSLFRLFVCNVFWHISLYISFNLCILHVFTTQITLKIINICISLNCTNFTYYTCIICVLVYLTINVINWMSNTLYYSYVLN